MLFSGSLVSSVVGAIALIAPAVAAATPYEVQTPPLDTPWTYKVGTNPWKEYPRPQRERSTWKNLNGIWTYQDAGSADAINDPPFGQDLANEVMVPSCLEYALSGIQGENTIYSWFRTTFTVPNSFQGQRTILNFGAVDYEATVFVNGDKVKFHRGGYFSFEVDVTDHLKAGQNELLVFVYDPTDTEGTSIPLGKQVLEPSHIFYRPCSGIWQQVWIEAAPGNRITQLDIAAGMDGTVNVTVHNLNGKTTPVQVTIFKQGTKQPLVTHKATANKPFQFKAPNVKVWSPDAPNLYDVSVKMGKDVVSSYTGFRTISSGVVNGVQRPLLNGKFIFNMGTLDQGFWPDGGHLPPNYEAMVYDLKMLKSLGFNMLRKHIKVEPALFYRACDEMGLMLIQDMPSMPSDIKPNAAQQKEFARQLGLLINQQKNYPSIYTWVVYNEGWGQITTYYPEFGLTNMVKSIDPTRLVDSTTGWYDHGAGDYSDNHHYANPQCGSPFYSINSSPYDPTRIGLQGEFGGLGHNVSAKHLWKVEEAILTINQTYEMDANLEVWNYRAKTIFSELLYQTQNFACSGAVYTQTTDVEGEVNGLLTYDRRLQRTNDGQWKRMIQALYDAAASRN